MIGNWITANLTAALDFFNAMMQFMYDILTINPVTYRGGTIWVVANTIYDGLLGSAISLGVILICMGIIEDAGEFIKHKNEGPFLWTLIKIMLMSGILIYGRYIMMWIFAIGKEFIDDVVLDNGMNVFSTITWATLPDSIVNATNGLTISSGIVFWVVTLLAALVIMVACFTIMLTVYGRIFKIYFHIALAPIPLACFASRTTMQHFATFIRSFVAVILEGLFIIAACIIFAAFANGFDINNPMSVAQQEQSQEEQEEEARQAVVDGVGNTASDIYDVVIGGDKQAANAEKIWLYLGEMLFLFVLMAGIIKAADDQVKKMIGV